MPKFYTTLLFTFFFLIACKPDTNNVPTLKTAQCLESQSNCFIDTQFGRVAVAFDQGKILTEVPFSIFLTLKATPDSINNTSLDNEEKTLTEIAKVDAYMEGKEMFMGKVPVFFSPVNKENNNQLTQTDMVAETMLGSCSQEQMVWRLWLKLTIKKSTSISSETLQETFFIDFTSTRF